MKKQQLQELVEEQQTTISELRKQISELKEQHAQEIDMLNQSFEEMQYSNWKQQNQKFLDKYLKEYITEHLSIGIQTEYGYVTSRLMLDNKEFSSETDSIDVSRNGLEE